jgi:hypothetical protein
MRRRTALAAGAIAAFIVLAAPAAATADDNAARRWLNRARPQVLQSHSHSGPIRSASARSTPAGNPDPTAASKPFSV